MDLCSFNVDITLLYIGWSYYWNLTHLWMWCNARFHYKNCNITLDLVYPIKEEAEIHEKYFFKVLIYLLYKGRLIGIWCCCTGWEKLIGSLGVPATSRILIGDCQKLSFSTLTKVPFLIFWSDNPLNAPALPS